MTSPPSRLYFVGTGHIAAHHLQAAQELLPDAELHASDLNADSLAAFTALDPRVRPHDTVDGMLASAPQAGDIVIICTPPSSHEALTLQALAGGRNVLCEKPFAMSADQAERMRATAEAAGLALHSCGSRFLDTAGMRHAKRVYSSGELGPSPLVSWINRSGRGRTGIDYQPATRWFLDRRRNGGGTLMDWGPYDFAALTYLLQPERVVIESAWMSAPDTWLEFGPEVVNDVEQHVAATLRYEGPGGRVRVQYERAAAVHGADQRTHRLEGLRRGVEWGWPAWDPADAYAREYSDREGRRIATDLVLEPEEHPYHRRPLAGILSHVFGDAPLPAEHANDAAFNMTVLRAIYDVAADGTPRAVDRIA